MSQEATDSLITDEMRAQIGVESEPTVIEVDRAGIRLFARAIGHADLIYYDEAAARAAGYRSLPCPPGYLGTPVYRPRATGPAAPGFESGPQPRRPLNRILNGGTEIEYFDDICAGDVLTSRSHLAALEERAGRLGEMLIATSKTVYTNQDGKVVAVATGTLISY